MARNPASGDFLQGSTAAINTILAEEANRIGADVHRRVTHTSPWIDLIKKTAFPDGMGYQLTTLVYDRALPTNDVTGNAVGANWHSVGTTDSGGNVFGTSVLDQPLDDAANDVQGPNGLGSEQRNYINFGKQLKKYSIERSIIESPRINVDDLRYAAHRQDQLRAVIDALSDATRHTWEERYRDECDKLADNTVICRADQASEFLTANESQTTDALGAAGADLDGGSATKVKDNISNAVMDKIYFQMIRKGATQGAYGRENGRPVFGLVCSSEASNFLTTESASIKDDQRYNSARVGDLIAPLGVEKSFRGFYHLIDDLAPRYTDGSEGAITRVEPYKVTNGLTTVDSAYDTAEYEVAYVIHPDVFESQIPAPFGGSNGVTFNPVDYKGEFKWTNILSEATNPDGTIGFFRGILGSASKPIKTEFGYAIVFKRNEDASIV